MTKHTATPWEVDYRGTLGHIKAVISPGMFTPTVCRFDKHLVAASLSEEERSANAAFICRACNEYESDRQKIKALKEALNGLISASATVFDHTQARLKNSVKLDYITYKAKAEQALKLTEEE